MTPYRHPAAWPARAAASLLAALALAGAPPAGSQVPAASPAEPAGATPATTPAADAPSLALGARLDSIGQALATSGAPTNPPLDLDAAASRVANYVAEVRERTGLAAPEALPTLAPAIIDSLISSLARIERDLDGDRRDLAAVAAQLEARRASLKADSDFLRAVLAVAGRDELPPTLLARSSTALRDIDATRDALRTELDQVAQLDGQLSELRLAVTSTVGEIRQVRDARSAEVLGRDQPPLWNVLGGAQPPVAFLRTVLAATWLTAAEYVRDYPSAVTGLVTGVLLVLALTFALRRASLGTGTDPATRADNPLVQRPVAVAVLVWVVVGPALLRLDPPLAIDCLRILIAAVAVWRLLPLVVAPRAARAATGVLALTVVADSALLAGTVSTNTRLLLFVVGILAALLLRQLARTPVGETERLGPLWGRVLRLTVGAGQYLAAAGVAGNLAGAVNLGNQLLYGTLFGVAVPLLLAVTDRVLQTMIDQAIGHRPLNALRSVRLYPDVVRQRAGQLVNLVLVLLALQVVPRLFPFVAPAFAGIGAFLATPLAVGGLNVSLLNVGVLALGIALALGAARLVRFLLQEEVLPRTPLALGSAATASRLTYYTLVIVGFFMALAAAGFELSQLTLLVSALGVGIGFGLQNIVNNFVSGIVLAFERPIQPGDMVAVGTMTGRVREIGLRATTVRTFEGADVIVPNSQFISAEVINWTLADRSRRIEIPVGVAYGTDLRRAQQVLRDVLAANPNIAPSPEPAVVFRRFGDSSIDFSALFWSADADQVVSLTSEVGMQIWEALDAAGITIPFPQRDVHLIGPATTDPAPLPADAVASPAAPPPAPPRSGGSAPAAAAPPADPE